MKSHYKNLKHDVGLPNTPKTPGTVNQDLKDHQSVNKC